MSDEDDKDSHQKSLKKGDYIEIAVVLFLTLILLVIVAGYYNLT